MPSFFGYTLSAGAVLLPIFAPLRLVAICPIPEAERGGQQTARRNDSLHAGTRAAASGIGDAVQGLPSQPSRLYLLTRAAKLIEWCIFALRFAIAQGRVIQPRPLASWWSWPHSRLLLNYTPANQL
jgi:hypothetical protein